MNLFLIQYFLGMDPDRFGLSFDAAIHTGTILAVVVFFRRDLVSMARAVLRSLPRPDFSNAEVRMAYLILIATVPAALISPWMVIFNLVFAGMLLLVAESVGRKTEDASELGPLGAFGVGLAQAAALLVPEVSRSGATITLGVFLGLRREEAARFSFLLIVPIIAGAGGLELGEVISGGLDAAQLLFFVVGFLTSAAAGYLAIRFLLRFLANHTLRIFAYYQFAAAVVAVVLIW